MFEYLCLNIYQLYHSLQDAQITIGAQIILLYPICVGFKGC